MLKVSEVDIAHELDRYLHQALTQTVVVEKADQASVVVLSIAEFERLQEAEDQHFAEAARKANVEGYLHHEHEVRTRLATAMRARRLACIHKP